MCDARREELAWAAGFFDGEGCTSLSREHGHSYAYMAIPQIHREVLDRFCAAVGFGQIYGPYPKAGNRQPQWRWVLRDQQAVTLVFELLQPWLGRVKIEQAKQVFKMRTWLPGPQPHRKGHYFDERHEGHQIRQGPNGRRCITCYKVWRHQRRVAA